MDYDSRFSASVKQKMRRIVEDSETPALMTAKVAQRFGDSAIAMARQIASDVKGQDWLRQEQRINPSHSGKSQSDGRLDGASDLSKKSKPLAMSLARGRAAKSPALKLPEVKAVALQLPAKRVEEVTLEPQLPAPRWMGINAGIVARGLWSKYSNFIWLLLIFAFLAKCVDSNEKQKIVDEKASVGTMTTLTGSIVASAYENCLLIGKPDLDMCAQTDGILVQDKLAKQLASAATDQVNRYSDTCSRHYSPQYCAEQLNRAIGIRQQSNK